MNSKPWGTLTAIIALQLLPNGQQDSILVGMMAAIDAYPNKNAHVTWRPNFSIQRL